MKRTNVILTVVTVLIFVGYLAGGNARGDGGYGYFPLFAFTNAVKAFQNTLNSIQKSLGDLSKTVKNLPANGKNAPSPWSQSLPVGERFQPVLGGAAVLDNETNLIWEQSPDSAFQDWVSAQVYCMQKTVGNRKGWRLATVQELASLVEPTRTNPALPALHPFGNIQLNNYWTATTVAMNTSFAWAVGFNDGAVTFIDKDDSRLSWCVRGGQGINPQ